LETAWKQKPKAEVSPMKLQKLIYFAHGWHWALADKPLVSEQVEAWKFGPVISPVYHAFKQFGNNPIAELGRLVRFSGTRLVSEVPRLSEAMLGETAQLLNRVWEVYSPYTAIQLSNATHAVGTPWQEVWEKAPERIGTDIPDEKIREYFVKLKGA